MSDSTPITQGLRGLMMVATLGLSKRVADGLLAECDNIDALHKALERENEELRKKLAGRERKKQQVGTLTVGVHLDFETLARDFEEAAKLIRDVKLEDIPVGEGGDAE